MEDIINMKLKDSNQQNKVLNIESSKFKTNLTFQTVTNCLVTKKPFLNVFKLTKGKEHETLSKKPKIFASGRHY